MISNIYKYVVRELHRGNTLPLIIAIILSWYAYDYADSALGSLHSTDEYVIGDQEKLRSEIAELKAEMKSIKEMRYGSIRSITY